MSLLYLKSRKKANSSKDCIVKLAVENNIQFVLNKTEIVLFYEVIHSRIVISTLSIKMNIQNFKHTGVSKFFQIPFISSIANCSKNHFFVSFITPVTLLLTLFVPASLGN